MAVVVVTAAHDPAVGRPDSSVVTSILHKPFDLEMLGAVLRDLAATVSERQDGSSGEVVDFRRLC